LAINIKNIQLSLLYILGLQSMMMQAAVESKDDFQDKCQAIIFDFVQ
jgi:hypothetical protein